MEDKPISEQYMDKAMSYLQIAYDEERYKNFDASLQACSKAADWLTMAIKCERRLTVSYKFKQSFNSVTEHMEYLRGTPESECLFNPNDPLWTMHSIETKDELKTHAMYQREKALDRIRDAWSAEVVGNFSESLVKCCDAVRFFERAIEYEKHVTFIQQYKASQECIRHHCDKLSCTPKHELVYCENDAIWTTHLNTPKTCIECPAASEEKDDEPIPTGEDCKPCVICMERRAMCLIRPCKHMNICITCTRKMYADKSEGTCPTCREKCQAG